jgi:hypothetical protein
MSKICILKYLCYIRVLGEGRNCAINAVQCVQRNKYADHRVH